MRKKNVRDIFKKIQNISNDPIIISECYIWSKRIEKEVESLEWYFECEQNIEKNVLKNNSIVSNKTITFGTSVYSYLEIKKAFLVRKFCLYLINK